MKKTIIKISWPTSGEPLIRGVHKIRLHGRREKETAESFSRYKLRQAPQKEGGEILCDPGWCVHESDVQNNWDDNSLDQVLKHASREYCRVCVFC